MINNKLQQLSTNAKLLLAQYQDASVSRQQQQTDKLKHMDLYEFLANGLNIANASFELAGRMYRKGWSHISYDKCKPGWQATVINTYAYHYPSEDEVLNMLEAKE